MPRYSGRASKSRVSLESVPLSAVKIIKLCTPPTIEQTVTVKSGVPVMYEGKASTAAEALKPGRHIRVIKPRRQIVQVLTADAWISSPDEVRAAYPLPAKNSFVHAVDGFLREETASGFKVTVGGKTFTNIDVEMNKGDPGAFLVDGQYVPGTRTFLKCCARRELIG